MSYAFRLVFRMAAKPKSDGLEKLKLVVPALKKAVLLKAQDGEMNSAEWFVAHSAGYATEQEARDQGEIFRTALILSGALNRLGIDCGFDKKTLSFSPELMKAMEAVGPTRISFHGLDVFEDNGPVYLEFKAKGSVLVDKTQLETHIGDNALLGASLTERQLISASLINDSFFIGDSSAAFIIRVTAVEALCAQGGVSEPQQKIIDELLNHLRGLNAMASDKLVIEKQLENNKRLGVRSAYMAKIRSLLGNTDAKQYDALYVDRGKYVHDGLLRGTLGSKATEALDLALKILEADIRAN